MREVRRDPLTGRWVTLSSARVPPTFLPRADITDRPAQCPFCPGHEQATESTIQHIDRGGRWSTRAFPNRRPALVIEEELRHRGDGPYDRVSGTGAHEVIVESPEHGTRIEEQPVERLHDALMLARWRLADLQRDGRFRSLWWFRNVGRAAGASLDHPHAQILATPVIAPVLQAVADRSRRWMKDRGRELLQDILDHDREDGSRLVWEGERVVALCPWAPQVPFEVWLVPAGHGATFAHAEDRLVEELAVAMRAVLRQLGRVLDRPAYNAWMVNAPSGVPAPGFRWHLRIQPRLVAAGGFEQATGDAVHWVFPEEAASALRG